MQNQAENRKKCIGVYYENHHIVPKSCNGSDNENNLVLLTALEHFDAHFYLCHIYKNDKETYYKMLCAFHIMNIKLNYQYQF